MSMARIISSINLQPDDMPPSAILLIRNFKTDLPAQNLDVPGNKSHIFSTPNNHWKLEIKDQIEALYRHALKPANMNGAGDEAAVLFADESELIACFIRDALKGSVAKKWWWNRHFGYVHAGSSTQHTYTRHLLSKPFLVPAVIGKLTTWNMATQFVKSMDAIDCRQITLAVLYEYELPLLAEQLQQVRQGLDRQYEAAVAEQYSHKVSQAEGNSSKFNDENSDKNVTSGRNHGFPNKTVLPPWFSMLGHDAHASDMNKSQLLLLGISKLLTLRPELIRHSEFQKQILRWYQENDAAGYNASEMDSAVQGYGQNIMQDVSTGKPIEAIEDTTALLDAGPGKQGKEPAAIPDANNQAVEGTLSKTSDVYVLKNHPDHLAAELAVNDSLTTNQSAMTNPEDVAGGATQREPYRAVDGMEVSLTDHNHHTPDSAQDTGHANGMSVEEEGLAGVEKGYLDFDRCYSETFCDSQLGGLFYLINLLRQLDLPACLENHDKLDEHVGRWALLDAVSRLLLGKYFVRFRNDPIWKIFAGLDKRKPTLPLGIGFSPGRDFFLPKEWLNWLDVTDLQQYSWAVYKNRLRIWTDSVFIAEHDIDHNTPPEQQVRDTLADYLLVGPHLRLQHDRYSRAPLANCRQIQASGIDTGLTQLLAYLTPFLRYYLGRILSLANMTPHMLLKQLLQIDARIFVSSSHVDLVANINQTSLFVRRAGLDQDPAWLPDYGRVVLFHFG